MTLQMSSSEILRDTLINECKSVTLKHLEYSFGRNRVTSLILHGSLARNQESYSLVNGRLYLESDIDLVAVIKKIDVIKYMRSYRFLSERIKHDLKAKYSLSDVSLVVITEKRLQHAKPASILQFRYSGRVIFGKDVIRLLPHYTHNEINLRELLRVIFSNMVRLLEHFANSAVRQQPSSQDDHNSVLKALQKMISILVRVIVIKEGIPVNPYDLDEIRTRIRNKEFLERTDLLGYLLESYEELETARNSPNRHPKSYIKKYWTRIVSLFSCTLVTLTGNQRVRRDPSEKMLFGDGVKLFRRIQLALYISPRFIGRNTIRDLGRAVSLVISLGPDYSYVPLYRLFLEIPMILTADDEVNTEDHELTTKLWLKSFERNFHIWQLSSCVFADSF
jgi:hypothetical protein